MDYAAEQEMELEALQAIFMDDMQEYDGNLPEGWSRHGQTYCVSIKPAEEAESSGAQAEVEMEMLFAHTPNYPDEPPSYRVRSVQGLSDADISAATAVVQEQVEANLGMAMIYTLFGAAQEWLTTRAQQTAAPAGASNDPEAERRRQEEAEEAARAAARAHGTPVTVEAFLEWKRRFDAELALQKAALEKKAAVEADAKGGVRMTGKAWFLQQHAAAEEGLEEGEEDGLSSDGDGEERGAGEEDDEDDNDSDFMSDDEDDDDDEEALLDALAAKR